MTDKADTKAQDSTTVDLDELEASAEEMLNTDEENAEIKAILGVEDGDDDGDEGDAESKSSAGDSQSDNSKAVENPQGDQSNALIKQLMEQNKLLFERVGQHDSGDGSKSKSEKDTGLPDAFESEEVPEGFEGLGDYLNDMGSKQLGFAKRAVELVQKLEERIFKLEGGIEIEFIKRELKVSKQEEMKILKWAEEQGFSYTDPAKAESVIKTYRKLQKVDSDAKTQEENSRSKRNGNMRSPGTRTKTTDDSEGRGSAEVTGSERQQEEAAVLRKTIADLKESEVKS